MTKPKQIKHPKFPITPALHKCSPFPPAMVVKSLTEHSTDPKRATLVVRRYSADRKLLATQRRVDRFAALFTDGTSVIVSAR